MENLVHEGTLKRFKGMLWENRYYRVRESNNIMQFCVQAFSVVLLLLLLLGKH